MPAKPLALSRSVADLLKRRRQTLGYSLREVEELTGTEGKPIPFSTLSRIEQGLLDPGVRRLQQLLRLYHLPTQAAGDLLDIEDLAGATPFERDPGKLRDRARAAWRSGDVSDALASYLAFRARASNDPSDRPMRQEAILEFAVAASSLGKHQLSRQMLDELLLERPEPRLLAAILVQQSVVWRSLGSLDAAYAFLERAAAHVRPGSHRESGWIHHQRALVQIDAGEFEIAARSLRTAEGGYRRARSLHDLALVLISFARLGFTRGRAGEAVAAATRAARFAKQHGFARLHLFALLEKARALQLAGAPQKSREILRAVLADSLVAGDNVVRFHAHYYLWRAELVGGDPARADVELREASYYLRFVDQTSPEATEVRKSAAPFP